LWLDACLLRPPPLVFGGILLFELEASPEPPYPKAIYYCPCEDLTKLLLTAAGLAATPFCAALLLAASILADAWF
jgi:hypothetical protein